MKRHINQINRITEKFKFRESVPVDVQEYILSTKKDVLKKTLKSAGDYSYLFGLILVVFFKVKKLGVSLSVMQCIIAFSIISTVSAGIIVSGTAISIKNITGQLIEKKEKTFEENKIQFHKIEEKNINKKQIHRDKQLIKIKNRLGIPSFNSVNVDSKTVSFVTHSFLSRLQAIKGKNRIISLNEKKSKNVNLMLIGSVDKLADVYMISVKIIDVEKGNALFIFFENVKSKDEIKNACNRLAEKIAGKM